MAIHTALINVLDVDSSEAWSTTYSKAFTNEEDAKVYTRNKLVELLTSTPDEDTLDTIIKDRYKHDRSDNADILEWFDEHGEGGDKIDYLQAIDATEDDFMEDPLIKTHVFLTHLIWESTDIHKQGADYSTFIDSLYDPFEEIPKSVYANSDNPDDKYYTLVYGKPPMLIKSEPFITPLSELSTEYIPLLAMMLNKLNKHSCTKTIITTEEIVDSTISVDWTDV